MSEIVKICKKHGGLTLDQTHKDKSGFRCGQCRRDSSSASQRRHREARSIKQKEWKIKNKAQYKKSLMDAKHKYTEELADSYVRQNLIRVGYKGVDITPEMIAVKKVILKIHRIKKAEKK